LEKNSAKEYIKSAETLGRIPTEKEIGVLLETLVTKDGKVVSDSETGYVISEDVVIARNPEPLDSIIVGEHMFEHSENRYNEWLVPKETWIKNYGKLPEKKELPKNYFGNSIWVDSKYYEPMKKIASIKALEVNDEIYKELETVLKKDKNNYLIMPVSWSPDGMRFGKGDFITDKGYTINGSEMKKTYVEKQEEPSNENKNDVTSFKEYAKNTNIIVKNKVEEEKNKETENANKNPKIGR
jgi:hypothetical protein